MSRAALLLVMLATPTMAADDDLAVKPPPQSNLLIAGHGATAPTLVITREGIVTNGAGVPLDELAPAEELLGRAPSGIWTFTLS
jgi:hypothetical protein